MSRLFLLAFAAATVGGCGKGMSDPLPNPPSNPFTPGDPGAGGYGSGSGGGGAGLPSGPPMCDTTLRRCAHAFAYGPMTLNGHEKTVTLIGDYRTDSWTNGDAAAFDGTKWVATVPVPWATQVTYKFHITYDNGAPDAYLPDPSNPTQVSDGFGGKNSVFSGTTCDTWTCASTQIACAGTPLAASSFDWRDAVIYWAFVDRFLDGDTSNDAPISDPKLTGNAANWQGGDWKGLQSKIADGYFAALGVNTLWITVPADNAESVGQGTNGDTFWYTAYHGYWPRDLTKTESRFGAGSDLTALVTAAHGAGMKVIADYAMNHVHVDSPIYQAHQSDGWFNPLMQNNETCVCNSIPNDPCNYDGSLSKSCWFAD
ncbi:MAG TPA: alpha-amylase family glycosyl hydrolase, partial [Polyangia bacterium]